MGTRQDRNRVRNRVLAPAIKKANENLADERQVALPEGLTLHSLRRTWASAKQALGADITQLMAEGGWSDPTVLLGIYSKPIAPEVRAGRLRLFGYDEDNLHDVAVDGSGKENGSRPEVPARAPEVSETAD